MASRKSKAVSLSFSLPAIIWLSLLVVISGLMLLYRESRLINENFIESGRSVITGNTAVIASMIEHKAVNTETKEILNKAAASTGLHLRLLSFSGKIIYDSEKSVPDFAVYTDNLNEEENRLFFSRETLTASTKTSGFSHSRSSASAITINYALRMNNYYLHASDTIDNPRNSLQAIRYSYTQWMLVLVVSIIIINLMLASKIDKPVLTAINFADEIANRDFSKRITKLSTTRIGKLQRSLNNLADALESHIHDLTIERNKLTLVIENITDSLCMINADSRVIVTNEAFRKIFGIVERANGLPSYFEIIRSSGLNDSINEALETNKKMHFELQLQNGKIYEIDINPIHREKRHSGLIVILHDITAKKQVDTMKTELVGNLSHELKTPITIVKGYLETMQLHTKNQTLVKELLAKCISNLDRQTHIINDMLKLNKLETTNDFETEFITVSPLLENCLSVLSPGIVEKKIRITRDYIPEEEQIRGNSFLAEQVFFNIITNAINYNKEGGTIAISTYHEENRSSNEFCFTISIADSGIGIPKESLARIFERFYRVDKGRSRATGGTGLGLAIVKHSVDLMGWKIEVESDSEGSCFYIKIPL